MGLIHCCAENQKEEVAELEELLRTKTLSIHILTWNVGGANKPTSLSTLLKSDDNAPDIIVVGLQEIIELNQRSIKHIIKKEDGKDDIWDNSVSEVLNGAREESFKYIKLESMRLMGVLLLIYVKDTINKDIIDIMTGSCGVGLFGRAPNKGAVGIRFEVFETSICFVCGHLAAHKPNVKDRNDNYHKLMKQLVFLPESEKKEKKKKKKKGKNEDNQNMIAIESHDLVIFFGDLNYRLDYDTIDTVYDLIDEEKWNELLVKDQLSTQIKENKAFSGFNEHHIGFQPTYKFQPRTSRYIKRIPSFCDRILWKMNTKTRRNKNKRFRCVEYQSFMDESMSDHKPVVGLFELELQMHL